MSERFSNEDIRAAMEVISTESQRANIEISQVILNGSEENRGRLRKAMADLIFLGAIQRGILIAAGLLEPTLALRDGAVNLVKPKD